ncbi:MAG: hypothetical protein CALGDGBN_01688 [Pseudomonadales bacterium]|nr:hypothetical protein [Pseudomonadales bacterium]
MPHCRSLLAATVFVSLLVAAGPPAHAGDQPTPAARLHALFDAEWERTMREDPLWATTLGDLRYNDRLGDHSLAALRERAAADRAALRELELIDPARLAGRDRESHAILLEQLSVRVAGQRFAAELIPIDQQNSLPRYLPDMVGRTPFRSLRHYEDYLTRLHQVPAVFAQLRERLREGLRRGITPPRAPLAAVAAQLEAIAGAEVTRSPFYAPFTALPATIPAAVQERLRREGIAVIEREVLPAYRELLEFWRSEYLPHTRTRIGIAALPGGKQWYAHLIREHTTTTMSAREIHELGRSEVARIRADMDALIASIGFDGDFQAFAAFLRTDPRFYHTSPAALLGGYRDICKRIDAGLPRLFGRLPRLPYGVAEVPAHVAPSTTTAYYQQGSLAAGQAGLFFANTYRLETRPTWEMEALSIHEAVPGHHLQIALAQELEGLPRLRTETGPTAFVEGWALYSESLGPELGLYRDPYARFGQLTYEMWRAVRLVVDTGIHAFGWTREQAIDYFLQNAAKQPHDIAVEVDRYIVWPAQALAYKIGELKIRALRREAESALGERFDIRAFHDVVLGSGAVPLGVLEANVRRWIAERAAPQPASAA